MTWVGHFESRIKLSTYFAAYSEMLSRVVNLAKGGPVLEVGAGSGLSSIAVWERGFDAVALDASPDVVTYMLGNKVRFGAGFPIVLADLFHLPFRPGVFGMAFSQGLLEHFDEDGVVKALREQARVGRRVLLDVPSEKAQGAGDAFGDERYWSWRKWQRLIQQSNLRVLKRYGWGVRGPFRLLMMMLPYGLFRLLSYMFTSNVGFVCEAEGS